MREAGGGCDRQVQTAHVCVRQAGPGRECLFPCQACQAIVLSDCKCKVVCILAHLFPVVLGRKSFAAATPATG